RARSTALFPYTPLFRSDRDRGFRGLRTMTPEHLRDVLRRGFEIGSHSATHADFRGAPLESLEREIVSSKSQIEEASGVPVRGLRSEEHTSELQSRFDLV